MRHTLIVAALLTVMQAGAKAQGIKGFCAAAEKHVHGDARLSAAVERVFGRVDYGVSSQQDAACIYPLQVLRYGSADVLMTIGNEPGQACHGCAASLSAYFLARRGGGLQLVNKQIDFATSGTFGSPGEISPIRIGGDDGIAIESGGLFQGHSYSALNFYAFHSGRVVPVEANPSIVLSVSDEGAIADGGPVTSVTGSWTIAPGPADKLRIDYKVSVGKRRSSSFAEWSLVGERWQLTAGHIPAEMKRETQ